jgi:hypothetical protein
MCVFKEKKMRYVCAERVYAVCVSKCENVSVCWLCERVECVSLLCVFGKKGECF